MTQLFSLSINRQFRLAICFFSFLHLPTAYSQCPDDALVDQYLAAYAKGIPAAGFGPDLNDSDAECAKFKLAKQLPKHLGALSGYKLGFVSQASRTAHGSDQPRWGYMFERNLIDIIAVIPANFGAHPLFDANLVVEIKDEGLADAATPLEALKHIESIVPFIELSDLMLTGPHTANELVATNLSFRGGIKGAEVPVQITQQFADALANFTVAMVDESKNDQVLGTARGDVLMGHPLNAAIWLAKALKQAGITLKTGDLLSLGSLIEPQKPLAGMRIKLRYKSLPNEPQLEVEFTEAFDRNK
jgi:2-oxo-hept-3-ene-1,7-dioate hydratase